MNEVALNPTHLFISYASEDAVLAAWLARKLAALGYAVWFDQMKMLGGEPWPQTIDDAIKNRTFRMLGLISTSSLHKQKPTGERVLAQRIADQRGIADFLIPLKVDDTELDWLTSPISYIAFNRSLADGLRQLLKKLDSIAAPKKLANACSLAAMSFPTGDDLITPGSEQLRANVIRVQQVPAALKVFEVEGALSDDQRPKLEIGWPFYFIDRRIVIAFVPPPKEFEGAIKTTNEQCSWADYDTVYGVRARDIVANLIIRSLRTRLLRAKCHVHPKRNQTFFLPQDYTQDGWLRFTNFRGQPARLKIRGQATFWRPNKPKEVNFHHFAFRLQLGRGLDEFFWIQITPSLFFFDQAGSPIIDDRVGPRRRRITKNWWNDKWLNRLLATEQLLATHQALSDDGVVIDQSLHTLEAPIVLNESVLSEAEESVTVEETEENGEFLLEAEKEGEQPDE